MDTDEARPHDLDLARASVKVGRIALAFGRVNRVTFHEDGNRSESDTDHTVMLGLLACAYASAHAPHLDIGRIAQFAFVHDLVEAYAGDTNTLRIQDESQIQSKEQRERESFERIKREFGDSLPWIPDMIETYERLDTPEARFVKAIDKALPKIVHLLNEFTTLEREHMTSQEFEEKLRHQYDKMADSYGKDQPEAMKLYWSLFLLLKQQGFGNK